jgi:PAS domain S-box-containing protein
LEQGRWFPVPTFLRAWITSPEITIEQVGKFFGRPGFTKMLDRPDYREFMKRGFISLIRYPIVRGGRVVAAMSLWSCTRTYSERDKKLFAALPVEQALLTALYYQETSELRFRLDLVRELSICKDNEILADLLVTRLASHYKWENVFIYKVSRAHGVFELQSQQTPTKIPKGYSQPLTEGILGEAYRKNKDINIANVRTDPKYAKQYKAVCRNSLSELCMPIRSDDTVIGLLNIEDPLENAFTTQEEHAIREVLDMVGEVMDRVANSNLITASFEATPTAVFILDERGIIEKVNPSALRLMHYREEKITGTAIRDYLCDPESLQDVLKHRGAAPKPTELKTGTGDRVRVLFKANRGRRSRSVVVSALVLESEISNP